MHNISNFHEKNPVDTKIYSLVPIKNYKNKTMSIPNAMPMSKVMHMPMPNDMSNNTIIAFHSKQPMEKLKKMNNILFFNNPPIGVNSIVKDIPSKNDNKNVQENSIFGYFY